MSQLLANVLPNQAREQGHAIGLCGVNKLNDKQIREALVSSLKARVNAPRLVLEEVQVSNGSAIADVVAVYKNLHCYEIKGETDSIGRVARQAIFYDLAFPLITLVTTQNHLRRALELCPSHWGIAVAAQSRGRVVIGARRKAIANPNYQPEVALLSLWRSELVAFPALRDPTPQKLNRREIAALIAKAQPIKMLNANIAAVLEARWRQKLKEDSSEPCK